ncbi:MAG TPA: MFS transporter, partial [Rhodobiaceae bacterium]|nr:MFS transporter [Rhodobiaceae bacterium]
TLMALFGWQQSWLVFGVFLALVALPLLLFLSRFEPLPKEMAGDVPTGSVA